MAKSLEKIKAKKLRKKGYSLKEIASKLKISKSTASIWCKDIKLTKEQVKRLEIKQKDCSLKGRLKGAKKQQQDRLNKIKYFEKSGKKEVGKLSQRDFFIAGITLYWGEGCKKDSRVGFSNSDPEAIVFMTKWFENYLKVNKDRFSLQLGINYIHKKREEKVKKYWSKITSIPLSQFVKTSFKKVNNKKIYNNFNKHFGTLKISISKSSELQYKIWGWLKALSNNKPG